MTGGVAAPPSQPGPLLSVANLKGRHVFSLSCSVMFNLRAHVFLKGCVGGIRGDVQGKLRVRVTSCAGTRPPVPPCDASICLRLAGAFPRGSVQNVCACLFTFVIVSTLG